LSKTFRTQKKSDALIAANTGLSYTHDVCVTIFHYSQEVSIDFRSFLRYNKPDYDSASPKLSKKEFENLTASIKEKGLREPIIINERGVILDGHHRFRACQALGIEIQPNLFLVRKSENTLEEWIYVKEVNLFRRQLNEIQRSEEVLKFKPFYEQSAKLHMSEGGKDVQIRTPLGRTNKQLADKANVKLTKFNQIEYVLNNASDDLKEKLHNDRVKPNKVYGKLRNEIFLQKQIAETQNQDKLFEKATNKITLLEGDFIARCSELKANSVSLILADPLYDEDHLFLYDGLGKVAMRLLQEGGSLITYINRSQLFVIGDKLLKSGLTFWWQLYLKVAGHASRMFDRHMEVDIKPLLWFVKGPRPINPAFQKQRMMESEITWAILLFQKSLISDFMIMDKIQKMQNLLGNT
jgi:hypothetical protein